MKLFVDVGNTALKWRRRGADGTVQGGAAHGRDWPRALQAPLDAGAAGFEQIWVASVAGAEADERIGALIEARTGVPPRFYYSRQEDFGVSNCYPEPRRLGGLEDRAPGNAQSAVQPSQKTSAAPTRGPCRTPSRPLPAATGT